MATYAWRTDAASGQIDADTIDDVVARLVQEREWERLGSRTEARDIERGAWMTISDADGLPILRRGTMP